jgi:hypothetical protein
MDLDAAQQTALDAALAKFAETLSQETRDALRFYGGADVDTRLALRRALDPFGLGDGSINWAIEKLANLVAETEPEYWPLRERIMGRHYRPPSWGRGR